MINEQKELTIIIFNTQYKYIYILYIHTHTPKHIIMYYIVEIGQTQQNNYITIDSMINGGKLI